MSKIGKMPIVIPAGVTVKQEGNVITVKGPKGELTQEVRSEVTVSIEEATITCSIKTDTHKNFWGLTRTLIDNMIIGVNKGYQKKLIVIGVGYDAQVQGSKLKLALGFSHPVDFELPSAISASVEKNPKGHSILTLESSDKQLLGQIAAEIRSKRPPEPYKGKGIRYDYEIVRLRPGKSVK